MGQFARMGFRIGDKVAEASNGRGRIDGDRVGRKRHRADGGEAFYRIKAERGKEAGIERMPDAREQQRVAVRIGLSDDLGRDVAGRARTVLDDESLAPGLLEALRIIAPGSIIDLVARYYAK